MAYPGLDGHGDHAADIIPPIEPDYPGQNWDTTGQAIWNSGCQQATMSPSPTETSMSPSPTETSMSPSPTETSGSPSPTETSASPSPTSGEQIQICHATGSESNPYEAIMVALPGLDGHGDHPSDIIPPHLIPPTPGQNWDATGEATWANGCQQATVSPSPTETSGSPTPTETSGSPSPTETSGSPTPTETRQVDICHATGSGSNPFITNTVSVYGLDGHGDHPGDIIPPIADPPYPGQNWDAAGQAAWQNGCQPATASPTPTVTVTETVTATATATETQTSTATATQTATATVTETATQTATATETVPGPTQTVVIPGPTIVIPGPTQTVPGPTQTVTVTATTTVLPPTTSPPPTETTSPPPTETTSPPPTSPTPTDTTVAPPTSPSGTSTTVLPPPNTPTSTRTATVFAPITGGNYPTGVNAGGGPLESLPGKPDWVWALALLAASIGLLALIRAWTLPRTATHGA